MKRIILPATVLSVLGGLFLTTRAVPAQAFGDQPSLIIQKLVSKFGLKQEEVQGVFNEARQERQQENQAKLEERLVKAVADGKISEAQKALILNKHKQMQTERDADLEAWKDLTREERQSAFQQRRDELLEWAGDNGIDSSYLGLLHEGRGGMGKGIMGEGRGNRGMMGQDSDR